MNRTLDLTVVAVMMLGAWRAAGAENTSDPPQEMRLEIELVDGSRLIGRPRIDTVPVQTPYAKMAIPLKQILTVGLGDDHETVSVDLQNGDKLKGVISLGPIELATLFGPVKVGIEHIRRIDVGVSGGGLSNVLARGLFLYYPFDKDEGNRVTDASGNGHDGRPQGSRWTPDGKVGGAFAFGGSDYVEMGYQPAGTEITLAAWIKPANTGLGFFLGTHFSESSLWMLTVEGPHGPPKQCARIGYNTGTDGESLFGTSNVQDGRWHHVAATIDSKGAKLYVDGVLENQNAVSGNWKGANAAIGRSLTGSPGFYSGLVDEVMIFRRPLTAAEIKQIYDAQKRGR
jgi:hypothetical protein